MKIWKPTFGKSLPRVRVTGVLLSAALAGATGHTLAADFYVGGAGASDDNPGTASAPFATIQKAASAARPGDVVKIRDGIYRETVAPANSGTEENPIVFEADAGAEPVISGANLLDAEWQLASHANLDPAYPIYVTTIDLPHVEFISHDPAATGNEILMAQQIFVRSKMQQEARWPKVTDPEHPLKDHGYARARTIPSRGTDWDWSLVGNNIRLRDDGLPHVPGGLAGAYCTVLTWYVPAGAPILSSSGNEFVIDGNMPNASNHMRNRFTGWLTEAQNKNYPDNLLYYVRGALGLLTAEGEFYYDKNQNKLYLWAPGGGVPANVEYKARNWGFDLTAKSHIHLKHLNFFACDIPTNGESLWPSNARSWDAIQPTPVHYTLTEKPTYPTVQAKADAEGHVAGAHPSDRFNPAAVPGPANGILIDSCRFNYLNHQTAMVAMPGSSPPGLELSETGIQQGNSNSNYGNLHRAGIRITGDNCVIRNSVFDTGAGSGVVVTGRNCNIENNYFKDFGYIGNWSSSIVASIVSTDLRIYGNTFWRAGRVHLWNVQRMADVGFNDWSEYSYLNVDGGGNYSQGRFSNEENHGSPWNEGQYSTYFGRNLLARKERPADVNLLAAFAFEGSVWHHNWGHDSRAFSCEHGMSAGLYFDDSTDGTVMHHNVLWNNIKGDLRAPNSRLDYSVTSLGIHVVFNNVFGTAYGIGNSTQFFNQGNQCRWTAGNNIYAVNAPPGIKPPHEFVWNTGQLRINGFLDAEGAYASAPANGKPWLIGFGPGQCPSGLGLQLKAGSPAINTGVLVSTIERASGILATDQLGRPLDYVDDPFAGTNPDAGAYEFNAPQVPGAPRYYNNPGHPAHGAWIPGTTLSQGFIEGRPWENQWPFASYAAWATTHGLTGASAQPGATPYRDGVPNLLKFALNLNGAGPDSRRMVAGGGTGGLPCIEPWGQGAGRTLRFEFVRRTASGLIYTPQMSTDLAVWLNLTAAPASTTPIDSEWERVVYEGPATTSPMFGRLEVRLP